MIFGEDRILASFQKHPPDLVLLVPRDVTEFGPAAFGRGYSEHLYNWIISNYRLVWHLESPPFQLFEKQSSSENVGGGSGPR